MAPSPSWEGLQARFVSDYDAIEDIFSRLSISLASGDREVLRCLWGELEALLGGRLVTEEQSLVPLLIGRQQAAARAIVHENRHLRSRLAQIGAVLPSVAPREVEALVQEVRAHARHEQTLIEGLESG